MISNSLVEAIGGILAGDGASEFIVNSLFSSGGIDAVFIVNIVAVSVRINSVVMVGNDV